MAWASQMLSESVAFDRLTETPDGMGGYVVDWDELFACRAEFRYQKGGEAVEAGGLTGQATFKVRIPAHDGARALTSDYRMRDLRRGVVYNIREIDVVSDRANVWLVAESGVAV